MFYRDLAWSPPLPGSSAKIDLRSAGGPYIVASTGPNIALKTSTDRTAWRNAGSAFPGGAPWTTAYTNGSNSLWAPDISYRNGHYVMYYAASTFGSRHSAIFLATSPSGTSGTWTFYHYYADSGASYLGINLIGYDSAGWPDVY